MDNRKWLKRKYSETFNEINEFLNDYQLNDFKKNKYKLGRLIRNVIHCQEYKKGSLIMFKRSNPINDYNYPLHHAVIKCQKGYTSSGYHSIDVVNDDFIEIFN